MGGPPKFTSFYLLEILFFKARKRTEFKQFSSQETEQNFNPKLRVDFCWFSSQNRELILADFLANESSRIQLNFQSLKSADFS